MTDEQSHSRRSLKFRILEVLADGDGHHKETIIGAEYLPGDLERQGDFSFSADERFLADQGFEELRKDGLLRPTYKDLVNRDDCVEITDQGRRTLELNALDELDKVLNEIDPHLIEIRDGAWMAIDSGQPDALRQSAHSGRELVDQVLRLAAPESGVRSQKGFEPDPTSNSGITRRHRLRFILSQYRGSTSKKEISIAEKACDLVLEVDRRLQKYSHADSPPKVEDVRDAITEAEIALRRILIRRE